MLRLLADENFNGDIVRGLLLRQPDLDLVRVQDVGLVGADDPDVLAWAAENNRIVLTHDRATMSDYAYERVAAGERMIGVFIFHDTHHPQELGIPSTLGTRQAVQELIKQHAGRRLPIRTVGEYLQRWGYTPQKPVRKAYKQDPVEVAEWLQTKYPEIERRTAGRRTATGSNGGSNRPSETKEVFGPGGPRTEVLGFSQPSLRDLDSYLPIRITVDRGAAT